jgi:transcriptional regulator with XRE-family HTH domain
MKARADRSKTEAQGAVGHPGPLGAIDAPTVAYLTPEVTLSRFTDLFARLEQDEACWIDAAKLEIAEQIDLALKTQNLKQADLARRLGRSRQYVTKLLKGSANLTLDSIVRIALALGCRPDRITQALASLFSPSGLISASAITEGTDLKRIESRHTGLRSEGTKCLIADARSRAGSVKRELNDEPFSSAA